MTFVVFVNMLNYVMGDTRHMSTIQLLNFLNEWHKKLLKGYAVNWHLKIHRQGLLLVKALYLNHVDALVIHRSLFFF